MKIDAAFKQLIPPLTDAERSQLRDSLAGEGCRDALVVWAEEDILLDGHNRYALCSELNVPFETVLVALDDRATAEAWIIRNQFARRNLTPFQRAELALKLEPVVAAQAKENQQARKGEQAGAKEDNLSNIRQVEPVNTLEELSHTAGVSRATLHKAKVIADHADEAVKAKLRTGESTVNREYNRIKQAQAPAPVPVELPQGEYSVLYADPPWQYDHAKASNRSIENQYPTMTTAAICTLSVPAAGNAVLLLWATAPKLKDALLVMETWGFTYKTHAIWDKEKIGMGYWFRGQHELLLVGTKGHFSPPIESARQSSVFRSPRQAHSQKPELFYDWIERAFPGQSYVELFARNTRAEWESWGNQLASGEGA